MNRISNIIPGRKPGEGSSTPSLQLPLNMSAIIVVLVLGLVAYGGYTLWKKHKAGEIDIMHFWKKNDKKGGSDSEADLEAGGGDGEEPASDDEAKPTTKKHAKASKRESAAEPVEENDGEE